MSKTYKSKDTLRRYTIQNAGEILSSDDKERTRKNINLKVCLLSDLEYFIF